MTVGEPPLPRRVVVVGAGTMGARIALFFARAGVEVCATARRPETLRRAADTIRSELDQVPPHEGSRTGVDRMPMDAPQVARESFDRICFTLDADSELARADLVVETIREDLADKQSLLEHVQSRVGPDAIVTSNTSSLDLATLSAACGQGPGRFAGLHWFNPADLVELVEVVPAPGTDPATLDTLRRWMTELGKMPVVLRQATPGFVANRLQYALVREVYALVSAGVCTLADADVVVTAGLGPRWAALGPVQCMDLAGLDVHLAVARALFPELATDAAPPAAAADLVAAGRLGTKSGSGLLGEYPPERTELLVRLRDRMLRCVAQVRTAPPEA